MFQIFTCGIYPTSLMLSAFNFMQPESNFIIPKIHLRSVDFPQPLDPSMP